MELFRQSGPKRQRCGQVWPWGVRTRVARGGASRRGARAARVAHSPESRALGNACIIIMTDADRAAAL